MATPAPVKMVVEPPGPGECMLATIAGLQGRHLSVVRAEALAAARVSRWLMAVANPDRYWAAVAAVSPDWYETIRSATAWPQFPQGTGLDKIPPRGRGVIVVRFPEFAHIMPWADGLIYDLASASPKPITLLKYLRANPSAIVYAIRTLSSGQKGGRRAVTHLLAFPGRDYWT